jgi:ribosome-associated protein
MLPPVINGSIQIPSTELEFRFVRSSGPGGQHVNRSATQVELYFDVRNSPSLTEEQKQRLTLALKGYIDKEGILHLTSQLYRSQYRNREEVTSRFLDLLRRSLRVPKKRRPTRPTASSREKRLDTKRRQAAAKKERQSRLED